jgi:hypothetical protein
MIDIKVDFHIGAKVEIVGIPDKEYPEDETYEVLFLDNKTNKLLEIQQNFNLYDKNNI